MHRRACLRQMGVCGAAALWPGAAWPGLVPPRPTPSAAQLRWQRDELALFVHLGVNTFTNREWGDGTEDPRLFVPDELDAATWAATARAAGFRSIVLTAKHHDGFCLWPSGLTTHSVASSPWRGGAGDVVADLARACRAAGLGLGLYLSPWDRHEPSYGSARYMEFYIGQMEELLTRYGPVAEVWFDGANGEGPNGRRQVYDWARMHATVRRLAPQAVMFSDAGPDVRWIGNERGVAGETCWSTIDPAAVPYAGYDAPGVGEILQRGDPHGAVWRPGETDVSIRPGWFWHPEEDAKVRNAEGLLDLYFTSVGRNSKLLLNVPPTTSGRWHPNDVAALRAFGQRRRDLLARDGCQGARPATGGPTARRAFDGDPGTYWSAPSGPGPASLELTLARAAWVNVVRIEEPIALGQTVERFAVEVATDGTWRPVATSTTIGNTRLVRFDAVRAQGVRLTAESSLGPVRISRLALLLDEGAMHIGDNDR